MNNSDPNHLVKHDEQYHRIHGNVLGHNGFTLLAFGCTRQFNTIKKIRKIPVYTKMEVKGHPYTNVHVYYW